MAGVGDLEKMSKEFDDSVHFLMVYIREAHANDEWVMKGNTEKGIDFAQPTTFAERQEVAGQCTGALDITIPMVVDDLVDTVGKAYGAWPDRLYVIAPDGTVAYQGGYGPFDFDPAEVREFLTDTYGPPVSATQ